MYRDNAEKQQNRFRDALELFEAYGYVMHPAQFRIYQKLSAYVAGKSVLEAGCGIGLGAAILSRAARVKGTDKSQINVNAARALYPWIPFDRWDISRRRYRERFDIVVAVEMIEHVAAYRTGIANLIAAAREELYISTPNRNHPDMGQETPINPFHVHEFTTAEFLELLAPHRARVSILDPDSFESLPEDTQVSPVVYRVVL